MRMLTYTYAYAYRCAAGTAFLSASVLTELSTEECDLLAVCDELSMRGAEAAFKPLLLCSEFAVWRKGDG